MLACLLLCDFLFLSANINFDEKHDFLFLSRNREICLGELFTWVNISLSFSFVAILLSDCQVQ